ncbi:MAG: phosphoribosyltransferase, partial [Frankiales bacterium]|nr:phosphoribosyltransferase [Frankiales bacterium]
MTVPLSLSVPLGTVVERGLGLTWTVHGAAPGVTLPDLVGLALRDNPKRAQLVVSRVLAKHLPVTPSLAVDAARRLAALVPVEAPLVLGWCETATGLGHLVADALPGSTYLHTTRRPEPGVPLAGGFEEEHSHATGHVLQPRDPSVLTGDAPLVLVDDELTTGTTVLNTIEVLPRRSRYVVATLLDLRPAAAREAFTARAAALGVDVEVVALLDGELPVDERDHADVDAEGLCPGGEGGAGGRGAEVEQRGDDVAGAPRQGLDGVERGGAGGQLVVDEHQRPVGVGEGRGVAGLQDVAGRVAVLLLEAGEQGHVGVGAAGGVDVVGARQGLGDEVPEAGGGLAPAQHHGPVD